MTALNQTALRAFAELSDDGAVIEVFFPYSPPAVAAIRAIPGRRFKEDANRNPRKFWTVPLNLDSGRRLREEFGEGLSLGQALSQWGREEVRRQRNLRSLAESDDAVLELVAAERAAWLRPYQRADVAMMAATNVLNANQPGVGKTVEVIYATVEANLPGPHLVIAPVTLHKDPWANELAAHLPDALVFRGDTPAARRKAMDEALAAVRSGRKDVWLIVNPDMVRAESDKKLISDGFDAGLTNLQIAEQIQARFADQPLLSKDHKGFAYYAKREIAPLFDVEWATVTLDEFHKHGLGEDRNTMFARAALALRKNARRAYALSGTPMGGKAIRLWGVLHFIEPETYGSKWKWAETWLEIDDNGYGKTIGGITPGREQEFYDSHAKHMVRRTRKEALPGLPDKVIIEKTVKMTAKQRKVYDAFEAASEVMVPGGRVSANGVLAEFARLKQFANAACEVVNGAVVPTRESSKLPLVLELLDEHGVRKPSAGLDPEAGARVIVASESKRMIEMVAGFLADAGLNVKLLTGAVTGAKRDAVIDWYKDTSSPAGAREARVLAMTTQTGGIGLNLGMTAATIILDETWSPDDQEQLEDRGMRDRTTPLAVYYLRTADSIQEYIWKVTAGKAVTNGNVLAIRAEILRHREERAS